MFYPPDEGYTPPEDMKPDERDPDCVWDDWMIDPETGEGYFPNDPMECYRIALLQVQLDDGRGIVRIDRQKRFDRLQKMREEALNARPVDKRGIE